MSTLVRGIEGESGYRRATVFIGVVLVLGALTILTIGARSPYTHANLAPGYDAGYVRTSQITVGAAEPYAGISPDSTPPGADPVASGATLFVRLGCVACHGLGAQGGVVGPPIAGSDPRAVLAKTRRPSGGMPAYSPAALSDDQAAAITAYLRTLPKPQR